MEKKIEVDDFEEIIPELRGVLETHNIKREQHFSILNDILFSFSHFLDQHQNSYLHEIITGYLDDNYEKFLEKPDNEIYMLGELQVVFGNKRKFTTNILNIHMMDKNSLVDNLIGFLRLEDIGETLKDDEIAEKFKLLVTEKREGIYALRFRKLKDIDVDNWLELVCEDYQYNCSKNISELAEHVIQFISNEMKRM